MSRIKTLDEFVKDSSHELQFTGNWFIDAGILGFVNLMEEVYGWDLEELQRRVKEEPEIVYYGYFPFAYFYKLSQKKNEKIKMEVLKFIKKNKNLGKSILEEIWWSYITELFRESWVQRKLQIMHESKCYDKNGNVKKHYTDANYRKLVKDREEYINNLVKNFKENIQKILEKRKKLTRKGLHNLSVEDIKLLEKKLNNFLEDKDFFENIWKVIKKHKELESYLNKIWSEVKSKNISEENSIFCRIPIDSSFFKNYMFFNNSRGIFEQLEDLRNLIDGNTSYSDYLSKIDRAISKFLPSDKEFPNISYTRFLTERIVEKIQYLFVYLINFLNAFVYVRNIGGIFFYGNNLDFTYNVNKKIKIYLNKNDRADNLTILRITWQAIIDMVVETETVWSLENMYLIRYERVSQQDLIGVNYIGIPKLQASIIIDDTLRDFLNKNIPIRVSNGKIEKRVWILEEFIRNKPLLPHLIHHMHIFLADRIGRKFYIGKASIIYTSIIDAKIKEFGRDNKLFGDYFFSRYKEIITEIKDDARWAFSITNVFRNLFKDQDERKKQAAHLLNVIRRNNKYCFVNILLKTFIERRNENNIKSLINFAFNKILSNDLSWENYAFIFVAGLIDGGEQDGGS